MRGRDALLFALGLALVALVIVLLAIFCNGSAGVSPEGGLI